MKKQLDARELAETASALALHALLPTIDFTEVPVMSRDRNITRKDQAKLARQLFSKLKIKGISVTAPNYSMASSVHVSIPRRQDYDWTVCGFVVENDAAKKANSDAAKRVEALLLAAFPRHEDRSDSTTDHFDFCWSVS